MPEAAEFFRNPRPDTNIGRMRHRVRLQQPGVTIDTHGQEIATYTTKATVHAEIRAESYGEGLVRYWFRMRGRVPKKISMSVKWRIVEADTTANTYYVRNLFDSYGHGREIVADCVLNAT